MMSGIHFAGEEHGAVIVKSGEMPHEDSPIICLPVAFQGNLSTYSVVSGDLTDRRSSKVAVLIDCPVCHHDVYVPRLRIRT